MELTVYRQSSKQRPDGTIVYKGEDARPFVDDQIFLLRMDWAAQQLSVISKSIQICLIERN